MLHKILLITLFIILSGCNNLPDPPKGDLCVMDAQTESAVCVPIKKVMKKGDLDVRDGSHIVPIAQMDNWVAFSPDTWANIQSYTNELKNLAEHHCN